MTPGGSSNGTQDGSTRSTKSGPLEPDLIRDLGLSCRQFVWAKLQIELDGTAETLPILDHYISLAREELRLKPDALPLVAQTVAAYFGTVLAMTIDGFWRVPSIDVNTWRVCGRSVYLAVNPVGVAYDVLCASTEHDGPSSELHLDRPEREFVEERLARLPSLREDDYFTLSASVEAVEIASLALRDHRHANGGGEMEFEPADYSTL